MFPDHAKLPVVAADPFAPVLLNSKAASTSSEQDQAVRNVLQLTSADSDFARKAFDAIKLIMGGGVNLGVTPVLVSLEPATGIVNTANLKIKCKGTDFAPNCVIYINGNAMPTTFTNSTEVFCTVTLPASPTTLSILVWNTVGAYSNVRNFTVTAS